MTGELNDCSDCASEPSTFKWGLDEDSEGYTPRGSSRAANFDSENPFVGQEGSAGTGPNPRSLSMIRSLADPVPVGRHMPLQVVDEAGMGAHLQGGFERMEEIERDNMPKREEAAKRKFEQVTNRFYTDDFYTSSESDPDKKAEVSGDEKFKPSALPKKLSKRPRRKRVKVIEAKVATDLQEEIRATKSKDDVFTKEWIEPLEKNLQKDISLAFWNGQDPDFKSWCTVWDVDQDRVFRTDRPEGEQ